MSWVDPITWVFKQVWSATLFNEQIRDNLVYLKSRPNAIAELGAVDQTGISTAWVKVTGSDLQIVLPVTTTLEFGWRLHISSTTVNAFWSVDVFDVDNNVYLSSGTITPSTGGLGRYYTHPVASTGSTGSGLFLAVNIPAGTHNYEIRVLSSAAATSIRNSITRNTVWVREVA